jgi:hypothetical protein
VDLKGRSTMNEYTIEKITIIKKSAEILLKHYKSRGFKNTLIETGLSNILEMASSVLEDIAKEKDRG